MTESSNYTENDCAVCGESAQLICPCLQKRYCNIDCQNHDWHNRGHGGVCAKNISSRLPTRKRVHLNPTRETANLSESNCSTIYNNQPTVAIDNNRQTLGPTQVNEPAHTNSAAYTVDSEMYSAHGGKLSEQSRQMEYPRGDRDPSGGASNTAMQQPPFGNYPQNPPQTQVDAQGWSQSGHTNQQQNYHQLSHSKFNTQTPSTYMIAQMNNRMSMQIQTQGSFDSRSGHLQHNKMHKHTQHSHLKRTPHMGPQQQQRLQQQQVPMAANQAQNPAYTQQNFAHSTLTGTQTDQQQQNRQMHNGAPMPEWQCAPTLPLAVSGVEQPVQKRKAALISSSEPSSSECSDDGCQEQSQYAAGLAQSCGQTRAHTTHPNCTCNHSNDQRPSHPLYMPANTSGRHMSTLDQIHMRQGEGEGGDGRVISGGSSTEPSGASGSAFGAGPGNGNSSMHTPADFSSQRLNVNQQKPESTHQQQHRKGSRGGPDKSGSENPPDQLAGDNNIDRKSMYYMNSQGGSSTEPQSGSNESSSDLMAQASPQTRALTSMNYHYKQSQSGEAHTTESQTVSAGSNSDGQKSHVPPQGGRSIDGYGQINDPNRQRVGTCEHHNPLSFTTEHMVMDTDTSAQPTPRGPTNQDPHQWPASACGPTAGSFHNQANYASNGNNANQPDARSQSNWAQRQYSNPEPPQHNHMQVHYHQCQQPHAQQQFRVPHMLGQTSAGGRNGQAQQSACNRDGNYTRGMATMHPGSNMPLRSTSIQVVHNQQHHHQQQQQQQQHQQQQSKMHRNVNQMQNGSSQRHRSAPAGTSSDEVSSSGSTNSDTFESGSSASDEAGYTPTNVAYGNQQGGAGQGQNENNGGPHENQRKELGSVQGSNGVISNNAPINQCGDNTGPHSYCQQQQQQQQQQHHHQHHLQQAQTSLGAAYNQHRTQAQQQQFRSHTGGVTSCSNDTMTGHTSQGPPTGYSDNHNVEYAAQNSYGGTEPGQEQQGLYQHPCQVQQQPHQHTAHQPPPQQQHQHQQQQACQQNQSNNPMEARRLPPRALLVSYAVTESGAVSISDSTNSDSSQSSRTGEGGMLYGGEANTNRNSQAASNESVESGDSKSENNQEAGSKKRMDDVQEVNGVFEDMCMKSKSHTPEDGLVSSKDEKDAQSQKRRPKSKMLNDLEKTRIDSQKVSEVVELHSKSSDELEEDSDHSQHSDSSGSTQLKLDDDAESSSRTRELDSVGMSTTESSDGSTSQGLRDKTPSTIEEDITTIDPSKGTESTLGKISKEGERVTSAGSKPTGDDSSSKDDRPKVSEVSEKSASKKSAASRAHACTWEGCEKSFIRLDHFRRHMKTHTGQKPFACTWEGCDKRFNQTNNLTRHMKTHTGEKPYKCPWEGCNKRLGEASNLTRHLRLHTGRKPFPCTWEGCGKSFADASYLSAHMRVHARSGVFSCTWEGCDKTFAAPSYVRRHLRTHTNEQPYERQSCGKRFNQGSNLSRHMRTHKKDVITRSKSTTSSKSETSNAVAGVEVGSLESKKGRDKQKEKVKE